MSKQEKMNKGRGNFLQNCTIPELEELLNAAAQDIPIDEAYVAELEATILRRETERPSGRLSKPDEAWERFRRTRLAGGTNQLKPSSKGKVYKMFISIDGKRQSCRPRRLGRVLLIAVVIVVLMTLLLPPVLGFRDIFRMVAQWTGETFEFVPLAKKNVAEKEARSKRQPESPLEQSLAEHNLPLSFAPKWFPEDRKLVEVEFRETEIGDTYFTAIFVDENEERLIRFKLNKYFLPDAATWETNDKNEIEFICNDITHYITTNKDCVGVHWYVDQYEVTVSGSITMDEAKAIVKSIYEG